MKSKPFFLVLVFVLVVACRQTHQPKQWNLITESPATIWEECFPLGNGHLGMMPDGGIDKETIVLNDITLWSGAPSEDSNPLALESLPEIQKLLKEGKNDEAQNLMYKTFVCGGKGSGHGQGAKVPFGCFQTLGNMTIEYQYPNTDSVTNYKRTLCLNDATQKVSFDKGGQHYEREAFISRPDDVAVLRLIGPVSVSLELSRQEKAEIFSDADGIVMRGQLESHVEGVEGMRYYAKAQSITENNETIIYFCAATDFMCDDPEKYVNEHLKKAIEKGFEKVKNDHLKAHHELFDRVELQIDSNDGFEGMSYRTKQPIDTLPPSSVGMTWAAKRAYQSHQNQEKTLEEHWKDFLVNDDPWLPTCYFHYGRYLLISSTQEDLLPPNLQGLWANTIQTPWNGDYHLNINVEMNHWPCEICNLSELHLPRIHFAEGLMPSGSKTARDFYSARGWTAHVVCNPWGFTAPGEHPSWGATNTGGAWLALHAWQHFEFTQDTTFLKEAYPLMKEAALFFLDAMIEEPEHGWFVTAPTTSPENAFWLNDSTAVSVCMGSTMDVQIVSELYDAVLPVGGDLGRGCGVF